MKHLIQVLIVLASAVPVLGQNKASWEEGTVSYISSQNIYVRFISTQNIQPGDTLFVNDSGKLSPALIVENKSSSSTVCTQIGAQKLKIDDTIIARATPEQKEVDIKKPQPEPSIPEAPEPEVNNDPVIKPEEEEVVSKEKIRGRLSAASYSNLSNYKNSHRMRYAFSFRGNHLNNSNFSVESYITFRHTLSEWNTVNANVWDALKVYALSVKYDFNESSNLTFGRKINPQFSSMGAIDGLQYEKRLGNIRLGAIAGTRPDYQDYSLNLNLFQYGGYASYIPTDPSRFSQTTLGFIEQMNAGKTDRRFIYFQHSGKLIEHLHLFSSFEVDLFEKINNEVNNAARLTNMYVALRYRLSRKWRFSASYDNRNNIIYYESYKSYIDQLIEDETRQGFRLGVNHRLSRNINWGVHSSLRFQKSKDNLSRNFSGHIAYNQVPVIDARVTVRANVLQTNFLDSRIFGARISRGFLNDQLDGEVYYRWVDYLYKNSDRTIHQDIVGASLSYRLKQRISVHLFYESVLGSTSENYQRINAKLIKRF